MNKLLQTIKENDDDLNRIAVAWDIEADDVFSIVLRTPTEDGGFQITEITQGNKDNFILFSDVFNFRLHRIKELEALVEVIGEKKKIMTWINCSKHDLLTKESELVKCLDCHWEIDEKEKLIYNQALADITQTLKDTINQLKTN